VFQNSVQGAMPCMLFFFATYSLFMSHWNKSQWFYQ